MRGLLIGLDSPLLLGVAALAGFLVAALLGWRLYVRANRRADAALANAARIDRELAASDATAHNLHERLEEWRTEMAAKDAEIRRIAQLYEEAQQQLTHLRAVHTEKLASFEQMKTSFHESRDQLKAEFQNLANQILEEKGRSLAQHSQTSLDALLKPLREQIEGFQKRVNQVHDETLKGNVTLGGEIRRVLEIGLKMSAEANNLAGALKGDKKTTGNWGEVQLERALELAGLVKGDHYDAQAPFRDGDGNNRQPDFIIRLPDGKHMVIDSKVSLVDYERALAAEDEAESLVALDAHVRAVRNHIDDLSRKDYSNLVGMRSPGFVLMFMPVEPAYIHAMKHNRQLFDYGYRRNVILVSYTTLMPILKTVANLWIMARSNEQAHEISDRAGDIYNQVAIVAERLKKLGETLATASRHYNSAVTAVAGQQGLYGKVSRFGELSARANKAMPAMEPLHVDLEAQKLDMALAIEDENAGEAALGSGLAPCCKS